MWEFKGDRRPVMGEKRLALTTGTLLQARKASVKDKSGKRWNEWREVEREKQAGMWWDDAL